MWTDFVPTVKIYPLKLACHKALSFIVVTFRNQHFSSKELYFIICIKILYLINKSAGICSQNLRFYVKLQKADRKLETSRLGI
jgi:hypothetical protein